ncbi:MAG: translocation/assembly module TamB domain-containing protein [Chloroherpetonaceae bacterium]
MPVPRIFTFLRRTLYALLITVFIAIVGVYIFLNTEIGERFLKSFAEKQFALLFNGRLTIERAELGFPTSLSLHQVKVFIADDSTESLSLEQLSLSIAGVSLHRNIEDGFIKELHIGRISLQTPKAVVVQEPDSALRFLRLLKPDSTQTVDTIESKPIKFLVDEIAIRNGDFWWINQSAPPIDAEMKLAIDSLREQNITPVNFDSLHLAKVNLLLKGEFDANFLTATLQELSFDVPEADFSVAETNLYFSLTPHRVELTGLVLKTSRSQVQATAALHHYDVFAPYSEDSLKHATFEMNLDVQQLALDDVKRLVPTLYFLKGNFRAKAILRGTPDSFKIDEVSLRTEQSRVGISGSIKNAFTPEQSELNVSLQNTYLTLADAAKVMPSLSMPDMRDAGRVDFKGGFNGRLNRFRARLAAASQFGTIDADVEIALPKNRPPEYAGALTFEHLNIGKALKDPALLSDLNLSAKLEGSGNSLETLNAKFVATMTKSRFGEYAVTDFSVNAGVSKKKFTGDFFVAMGEQFAEFSGIFDLSKDVPIYQGEGRLGNFDISTFTKNDSLKSNLTLKYTLEGSGIALGDVSLDFNLELDSSTIGKLPIPKGTAAHITLVQNQFDSSATFVFHSDLLDVEVEGKYDLAQLVTLVQLESGVIEREIYKNNIFRSKAQEERFKEVSKKVKTLEKSVKKKATVAKVVLPTLNVKFNISLKSLSAMSLIAKAGYFNAKAQLSGKIISQPNQCTITAIVNIDSTTYSDMFFAQNFSATFGYVDDVIDQQEHQLRAKLNLSAFRLKTGDQRFVDTKFEMRYDKQAMQVGLRASNVNTRGRLEMDMLAGVFDEQYIILLENLKFATSEFSWEANSNSEFQISPQNIRFSNVAFRNKDQELSLKGFLEFDGDGNVSLALKNFNLADFRKWVLPEMSNAPFGGRVNLALDVSGNLQRPVITFGLDIRNLIYSSVRGGNITLQANYQSKWMDIVLAANLDSTKKSRVFGQGDIVNRISGRGRIPINLDSDGTPFGFIKSEEVFAEVRSNDLAASALEAFVPLERTTGFIKLLATVRGRFPSPDIRISLLIDKVKTTPIATQVEYTLDGEIVATPSGARWTSITFNDRFGGEGSTSGAIKMNNFAVETLDVGIAFNRLHLMRKPEGKDGLPFGSLIASSDNLRYFGTLDAPKLTGRLTINEGDMSSFAKNANNATQFAEAAKFITMRAREDTTLTIEERARIKKERRLSEEFSMDETRTRIQAYQITPYDLMTMDLRVRTQRRMLYTIIFNKYLGEQMKVSIEDVDIRVRKRGINLEAFGSASIAGGSYTAFTKNFEVKPGGKISWNEEDILNASINVTAETRTRADNPDPRRAGVQAELFLIVKITGTALAPNMAMGYRFEELEFKMPNSDLPGFEDPNAVLNFALLLSAGQWYAPPVELGGSSAGIGAGTVASAGLGAGAGLLSSQLSRVAGTIAGVQSVNIGLARDASGGFSGVDLAVAYAVPGTDGKLVVIGSGSFANNDSAAIRGGNTNSQKLEYRVSDKVVLEAFRVFGQNNFTIFNQEMQELWGFGVAYRDNFHTWSELSDRIFRRKKDTLKPNEKKKTEQQPPDEDERVSQPSETESAANK